MREKLFSFTVFLPALALGQFSSGPFSNGIGGTPAPPPSIVTVCSSGCTTDDLQLALDSLALCGDIIQIKSSEFQTGNFTLSDRCSILNRITVTSDRRAWLPFIGTRITPAHLANMAILRTNNSAPALCSKTASASCEGALVSAAKHWILDGIAFSSTRVGSFTYNLVNLKTYTATSNADIPDDIQFRRCYFFSPLPNGSVTGVDLQNAIQASISNLTITDSFFGDVAFPGVESHSIILLTTPGPATIRNSFFVASSIPIFGGGAQTDYPVTPSNIDVQYNYTWRPWKWNSDPTQPFFADYTANKAFNAGVGYDPCLKNNGEFKFANGVTWRYNVHENMWMNVSCQSQSVGFANTIRTNWVSSVFDATMGTMNFIDASHVAWSGTFNIANAAALGVSSLSYGVCVNIAGGMICVPFTAFDNTAKTITASVPFASAPAGNYEWFLGYDASQKLNGITYERNVQKNVSHGINNLGLSTANGVVSGSTRSGTLTNVAIRNNLVWNTSSYMTAARFWFGEAAEESFSFNPSVYDFSHNTFFSAINVGKFFQLAAVVRGTVTNQPLWNLATIDNNLAGPSADFPVFGDSTATNVPLTWATYFSNSTFRNNGLPGVDTRPCTGSNTCSGNLTDAWVFPFVSSTILKLKPGTIYSNAGTDGKDLGADWDQLPLVTGLAVVPLSTTALLQFDLNAPIGDAGNTQPCVLEVSSSRNLQSDLNTYAVTNDLNPTFFQQPDTSARVNPKLLPVTVAARHVSWPIGQAATVVGDDGVSHNLRLIPSTLYYGRLMCYGDTEWFTFTTLP